MQIPDDDSVYDILEGMPVELKEDVLTFFRDFMQSNREEIQAMLALSALSSVTLSPIEAGIRGSLAGFVLGGYYYRNLVSILNPELVHQLDTQMDTSHEDTTTDN